LEEEEEEERRRRIREGLALVWAVGVEG